MDKRYLISYYFNNYEIDTKYILDIIKIHKIDYTENSNGIFINISLLCESIINNIYENLDILIKGQIDNTDNKELCSDTSKQSFKDIPKQPDKIRYSSFDKLLLSYSRQSITI
tara:strand:+ start:1673 stop:2011 length:339 start_codon:yes stop_codon:yes gene_type:complete